MSFLRALFGPSQEEIWSQLSREMGASMVGGTWGGVRGVQAKTGDWIVTLDTYTQSNGKSSTTYTRIRAPFVNGDGFRFAIYRAGFFTELGKLFGIQDIEIGDPFFDETFVVQGNQEGKVRALFDNPKIAGLLHAQPQIYLAIQREESWLWGSKYPETVDILYFQVVGVIKDVALLKSLFDLYAEILNQLCHMDQAYQDDVNLHIRDLTAPGGQVISEDMVLWDGRPPRWKAAEALGRMKARVAIPYLTGVLGDPDPVLRATAAWALGEIAEPAAAPPILGLLADQTPTGRGIVREFAATALRQCGMGQLVDAYEGALEGDQAAVEVLRGSGRTEIIPAFVHSLHSHSVRHAANSAWALGELVAVHAIGAIRDRLRALRRSADQAQVARMEQAIRLLERHSELPRPATSPTPSGEDLPLPSTNNNPPTALSPSSVQFQIFGL